MILEVKDLHSYYGQSHVLQGVDICASVRPDGLSVGTQRRGKVDDFEIHYGIGEPESGEPSALKIVISRGVNLMKSQD